MRYRAKKDVILISPSGEESFVAKGDKVFIQQDGTTRWKIYSFYTRKVVASLNATELQDLFGPEEDFERPRKSQANFIGRSPKKIFIALLLSLSLGVAAQQPDPIKWSVDVVKVRGNIYHVQLEASIDDGWWLYQPNFRNLCVQPTLIRTLMDTSEIQQLEDFNVIDFGRVDSDRNCGTDRYYQNMVVGSILRLKRGDEGTIKIIVTYQPTARYGPGEVKTLTCYVPIEESGKTSLKGYCTPAIRTVYPKGPFRTVWWCVRHPFGPYYIRKELVR